MEKEEQKHPANPTDDQSFITLEWLWDLCTKKGWTRVQEYLVRPIYKNEIGPLFKFAYDNWLNELLASDRLYVSTNDSHLDGLLPVVVNDKIAMSNELARGKGRGKKNMARLSLYNTGQHSVCVIIHSEFPRRRIYGGTTKKIISAMLEACETALNDGLGPGGPVFPADNGALETHGPLLLRELLKLRRKVKSEYSWSKEPLEAVIPMTLRRYWRCEMTYPGKSAPKAFSSVASILHRMREGLTTKEPLPWLPIPVVTAAVVIARVLDGVDFLNVAQTAATIINVWCNRTLDLDQWTNTLFEAYSTHGPLRVSQNICDMPMYADLLGGKPIKARNQRIELLAQYYSALLWGQKEKGLFRGVSKKRLGLIEDMLSKAPPYMGTMVRAARECAKLVHDSANAEAVSTKDRLPKGIMFVETVPLSVDEARSRIGSYLGIFGLEEFQKALDSPHIHNDDFRFFMLNRLPYHQLAVTMENVFDELYDIVPRESLGLKGFPVLGGCILMINKPWLRIVRAVLLFLHARVSSSRCSDDVPLFPIVAQWLFPVAGKRSADDLDKQEKILLSIGVRQMCCWFESNRSSRLIQALGSLSNIDSNAAFHAVKTIIYQWGWESGTDESPFQHPWMDWLKQTRSVLKDDSKKTPRSRSVRDECKGNVVSSVFELIRVGAQTDARLEWIDGTHKTLLKYLLCRREDFEDTKDDLSFSKWFENDWIWNDSEHVDTMRFITGPTSWLSTDGRGDMPMTLMPGTPVIQQKIWALIYDKRFPSCLRRYILNRTQIKRKHEALDKRGTRFSENTLEVYNSCVPQLISAVSQKKSVFIEKIPWRETTSRNAVVYSLLNVPGEGFRPPRQGSRMLEGPDAVSQELEKIEMRRFIVAGIIDPSTAKTRWHVHQAKTKGSKRIKQYQKEVLMYTSTGSNTALGKEKGEADEEFEDDFVIDDEDDPFVVAGDDEDSELMSSEGSPEIFQEGKEEEEEEDEYDLDDFLVVGDDSIPSAYVDKPSGPNKRKRVDDKREWLDDSDDDELLTDSDDDVVEKEGDTLYEKDDESLGLAAREITRQLWEDMLTNYEQESCDWRLDLDRPLDELDMVEKNTHTQLSVDEEKKLIINLCLMCERGGITKDRSEQAWFDTHWSGSEETLDFPVVIDKEVPITTTNADGETVETYSHRTYNNCLPVFRLHQRHSRIFGETASTLIPDLVEFYKDQINNTCSSRHG